MSDIGFVFVTSPDDPETLNCLMEFHTAHPEVRCFDVHEMEADHKAHIDGYRAWNRDQYHTMVALRNTLLAKVRCHEPDRFFSLDSDVLLQSTSTLSTLTRLTEYYDAVSPLMYMTPDSDVFPNVMTWYSDEHFRAYRPKYPIGTLFEADVIMAAVMMSRPVYENVNYMWHHQGEDLGWSREAKEHGYHLYSASYLYAPHIMNPTQFKQYLTEGDNRCSYAVDPKLILSKSS
jgi:hypothetical protein